MLDIQHIMEVTCETPRKQKNFFLLYFTHFIGLIPNSVFR